MARLSLALIALPLALGCAADGPARSGSSGKADSLDDCAPGKTCLLARDYDVLFTNPVCRDYEYEEPVESASGDDELTIKPKNVYCSKDDAADSGARAESPQFRLAQWIDGTDAGDEIFLAYLSFSDPVVTAKLCDAVDRGVEVDFVLDKRSNSADTLEACGGNVHVRGHQGSVGFQHNKILMVNPRAAGPNDEPEDEAFLKLTFSSGNMSSGTVLHHENWHFVEVARESFFAEVHLCVMDALLDPEHTDGKGAFRSFMNECRADIDFDEEEDIKTFFIPNLDDSKAAIALLKQKVGDASKVDIGAHRFSFSDLVNALSDRLEDGTDFEVRLVADDDLYWTNPLVGTGVEHGPNLFSEGQIIENLEEVGGDQFEARYMETNHSARLLHHNKFLIFQDLADEEDSVLFGAANLTGTGFKTNLENIYWSDIPLIVNAFKRQYGAFWDGEDLPGSSAVPPMATAAGDMPSERITVD